MAYRDLVTTGQRKPRFLATVDASTELYSQIQDVMREYKCDIDNSVGQQLDFIGEWVGQSRVLYLRLPLDVKVLTWKGTIQQGWNHGWWGTAKKKGDIYRHVLGDKDYRKYLKFLILSSHWDGTIGYVIDRLATLWPGVDIKITDNRDMTVKVTYPSGRSALEVDMFISGYYWPFISPGVKYGYEVNDE